MNLFKNLLEKLKKQVNIYFSGFFLFLLIIGLLISDFNFLKIYLFILILIFFNFLGYQFYLIRKPSKEKSVLPILTNILENLQEGIVFYDENLKIIYANKKFAEIVKLKKEDLEKLEIGQWMLKNKTYEILGNIFFPFINGEEIKIISEKPFEIIEVSFKFPEEKYYTVGYWEAEIENKKTKIRLVIDRTKDVIESQKRMEFIQLVSHNLLTPLSEIRWLLESIDEESLNEENRKIISDVLEIVRNSIVFSQNILTFVRAEKGVLSLNINEFNLEELLKKILLSFQKRIKENNLKIEAEIYEKAKNLIGDETLIFLALFSLIENAIVYNKTGGLVKITAQKVEGRPYAEIIIEDTGIGMSPEVLENLFKPYFRGEKAKEKEVGGFGIGLYLAKKIVDLHGGEIKVFSEENKGTKVVITLPLEKSLIPGII